MSPEKRKDVVQNAIESSGKERTFIACALKIALRKINRRSKCNIIMMDEIMGKLLDESVGQFLEFLNDLKNEIDIIIIIEHTHTIDYDYIIEVSKNDDGVSSLKMY